MKLIYKDKSIELNPELTYIIHKGKCYEVPKGKILEGYTDTFIFNMNIQSLPEVKPC